MNKGFTVIGPDKEPVLYKVKSKDLTHYRVYFKKEVADRSRYMRFGYNSDYTVAAVKFIKEHDNESE